MADSSNPRVDSLAICCADDKAHILYVLCLKFFADAADALCLRDFRTKRRRNHRYLHAKGQQFFNFSESNRSAAHNQTALLPNLHKKGKITHTSPPLDSSLSLIQNLSIHLFHMISKQRISFISSAGCADMPYPPPKHDRTHTPSE